MASKTANVKTKKDQAIALYKQMNRRKTAPARKDVLAKFQEKIGMSKPAAATYYQRIASGEWS